jgi:hypothetical protein
MSCGHCGTGAAQTQHHDAARERTGNMRRGDKGARPSLKPVTPHAHGDKWRCCSFDECLACACMQGLATLKNSHPAMDEFMAFAAHARSGTATGTSHPFEAERDETAQRLPSPAAGPASLRGDSE